MFYVYAIVIPVLALVALYYMRRPRLKVFSEYIDFIYRALPFLIAYALVLYCLETNDLVNSGYAFLAFITFLAPLTVIILALKLYNWFRLRR